MRTAVLACPACGTPLQIEPAWAGGACRCGACGREFRVPVQLRAGPALLPVAVWRRVHRGLGLTYFGGLILLVLVLSGVGVLVAFCLYAPPELWEEMTVAEDPTTAALLLALGSCGLGAVAFLAFLGICIGCLLCLAAPPGAGRGWLAASSATLIVGTLALMGVMVCLVAAVYELEQTDAMPDGLQSLLGTLVLVSGALGLLTAINHGGFLRRLAGHLGDETAARRAAGYQIFLLFGSPFLSLGLCLLGSLAVESSQAGFVVRAAALLVLALILGWWLALVLAVRRRIGQALW